jgi:hypothetical protein
LLAFQECFLSKRRLFFTDREIAYICEEGIESELGDHKCRYGGSILGHCLPHENDGLRRAYKMLVQYTNRDLTYDSDALNAIVGALNTLNDGKSGVYHIWGLLFEVEMEPPFAEDRVTGIVNIGIFWKHPSPCHRRVGFPSWSPLGWKGNVSFDWLSTIRLIGDLDIKIWLNNAYIPLHPLTGGGVNLQNLSSTNESQVLRISALTVPFTKVLVAQNDGDQEKSWHIKIHVNQVTDVFILPEWDLINGDAPEIRSGICVFIPSIEGTMSKRVPNFMVLDESGAHYERSGVVDIDDYYYHSEGTGTRGKAFVRNADGDFVIRSPKNFKDRVFPALSKLAKKQTFLLR